MIKNSDNNNPIKYILYLGDLHFKTSNNKETDVVIKETLKFLEEKVKELNISSEKRILCVLGGDLLHEHEKIFINPMNKIINFIESIKLICGEIIILVGNHDYENNRQFFTDNHWMNALKKWENVIIVDEVIEKYNMIFMPYVPPGMFVKGLNKNTNWKKCKYIFAHQEFKGCDVGLHKSEVGDYWDKSWPTVISGHIHKPQKLQENIIYPGSVIQHTYGEGLNYTGLYFIDIDNDIHEKIHIDLPDYKTIKVTINDTTEGLLNASKILSNIEIQNLEKLRIEIDCDPNTVNAIKKTNEYKKIPPNVKVVFKVKLPTKNKDLINNKKEFITILEEKIGKEEKEILYKIINGSKLSFTEFI